jgi:hemerythrin superfamily protein
MAEQTIFERLIEDHDTHRALIEQIEQTTGDSEERQALFAQFKTDATAHAATEELTLYHDLMGESKMRAYAQHAAKDHHELEELFKELDEMEMGSSGWLNRFKTLKDEYLSHLKEEEETIFPDALKDIGTERAVELRADFEAQKPEEIERAEAGCDEEINEKIG